jgi:hypothetical protein
VPLFAGTILLVLELEESAALRLTTLTRSPARSMPFAFVIVRHAPLELLVRPLFESLPSLRM